MWPRVFWTALAFVFYVYLGYPALLVVWRWLGRRPVRKSYIEPSVSIVIAMHNERKHVQQRIANLRELDYPREKLQIIVSLDAPSDGTEFEAAGCGVDMIHCRERQGKAAALNRGIAAATGEVLVFTDARQTFDKRAVRELVANFADESVGAVSGELVLLDPEGRESGLYWRYEKMLRAMEGAIHSVPGATGGIYAVRRHLCPRLERGTVLDDVAIPMRIVLAGKRVVFDPSARAYDKASASPENEYRKKQRTLAGNYQLLVQMPELLVPWRNPIFVQFLSHKVGRLIAPYCLMALFLSSMVLNGGIYVAAFAAQSAWYLLALAGWLASRGGRPPARSVYGDQV